MNTPEQSARKIFGRRAEHYTTSACHADPQVLGKVVALSKARPGWRVLDVATGTGHTAFAVAPSVSSVVGIDLTPEMLTEARRLRAHHRCPNVTFQLADVHDLPYPDASFDLITCRRAAHHFSDISGALREMRRVLCDHGRVVIDDRSVPEDDFVDECMNALDRYHDESHIRQYRPSKWALLLREAGFRLETVEPYTRHRPLSSLTQGVSEANVQGIRDELDRLDEGQREALNLVEVDGLTYINHWYVMLAARKE